jgi:hypothetical protein
MHQGAMMPGVITSEYDGKSSQCFQAPPNSLKMSRFPSWPGFVPAIHVFVG